MAHDDRNIGDVGTPRRKTALWVVWIGSCRSGDRMKGNHKARQKYTRGFYPKSRGAIEYIAAYSDAAWKLYDFILANATWNVNERNAMYGTYEFQISEMARELGHHSQTVKRSLRELHFGYPDREPVVPSFIAIVNVKGSTRSQWITVKVLKAKLRVSDYKRKRNPDKNRPIEKPANANPETIAYLKNLADDIRKRRSLPEVNGNGGNSK